MDATGTNSVTATPILEPEDKSTSVDGWITFHADPGHKLAIKPVQSTEGNDPGLLHQSMCSCGQFRSEPGVLEDVVDQARQHRAQARKEVADAEALLALRLDPDNDSGARDVRGYLVSLLITLWFQGDGFSSDHPFGNTGWQYDVYTAMVKAGVLAGSIDEDGNVECDFKLADVMICNAIRYMGGMSPARPRRMRQPEQE